MEPAPTAIAAQPQPPATYKANSEPQRRFLATKANIAVYGGAAGAGKTYALLIEQLRHINVSGFNSVIFRETRPQLLRPGGLWEAGLQLYDDFLSVANATRLDWTFDSGAKISLGHLDTFQDLMSWKGAQVALLCFDQLEEFTEEQFWYMLSRNRSTCGVRPYIRATCNPDPDSFLAKLMEWWIDQETGYPIESRSGVLRWFVRDDDRLDWGDSRAEMIDRHGADAPVRSFTFIPGFVEDNADLMRSDPSYVSTLRTLKRVERLRLWRGNWKVRYSAGDYFRREWFEVVDAAPAGLDVVRYWDRAATEHKTRDDSASWTAGVKIGKAPNGLFYVMDVVRIQGSPLTVEQTIKNTATQDGSGVRVGIEKDPGQAGVAEAGYHVRNLSGFVVKVAAARKAKALRAGPFSAQVEAGNVKIVRGLWNVEFLDEMQAFDGSESCTSDQVDAAGGAFNMLTAGVKRAGTWG